ncbi:MAG: hypothetical protein ACNI26_13140 [Terasakiella sp.]|uniref:hypothetical protein n=1 Tax=unclassified Terasakiella TaxID=2614952 RepID=UPI003B009316
MSRDFGKVATGLWRSKKFKKLGDNSDAKLLYIYILTNSNGNSIGCYELPTGYIMADLRWDDSRIDSAMIALSKALLIDWNEDEEVVSIVNFLTKSPITNKKHAIGAFKTALNLPECNQKHLIINEIVKDKYASELDEVKAYLDRLDSPIDSPMHTIETETETETETERETQTETQTQTERETQDNNQIAESSSTKRDDEKKSDLDLSGLSEDEHYCLHGEGFGFFWLWSGAGSSQTELRGMMQRWLGIHGAKAVRKAILSAMQPDVTRPLRYFTAIMQNPPVAPSDDEVSKGLLGHLADYEENRKLRMGE